MLSELLQKVSLFSLLYRIDLDLAEQVQSKVSALDNRLNEPSDGRLHEPIL